MFKDYDKYLSTSVKVYLFVLIVIFIMKLVGLDYFGLDINNPTMIELGNIFDNFYIKNSFYCAFLMFYQYIMLSIVCNDNSKTFKIVIILSTPLTYGIQFIKNILINYQILTLLLEMAYLFILSFFYNKFYNKMEVKKLTKRFIIVMLLNMFFQMFSMLSRYKYDVNYVNEFIPNVLLTFDYCLLLIITYNIVFTKRGDEKKCYQEQVGSSLLKKLNFKNLLKKSQKNWHSFKKLDKVTKLTYIIYFILSLFWNIFCVLVVLFVAFLNDTFIECIFILTSFWLSKGKFGKAFHFKSMGQCFIVSNLSYYILNRLTSPLGISILIPIMLGVGLSYVTSKFVKKTYKPLYRGMPEELFEETILKVADKDSQKYKICYDFYIKKKSIVSLSIKYHYTEAGIRKIKDRINKKIKELN